MTEKKDFMPMVYEFKNVQMEEVPNTNLFNSFLKTTKFEQVFNGTLWAEGPCYICLLYTSPSPRDGLLSRMPSSA